MNKVIIGNVPFNNITTNETHSIICDVIKNGKYIQIVTPNIDHLALAEKDLEFLNVLWSAEMSIPDGMGIVYLSKLIGNPLKENIGGRVLFMDLCVQSISYGWKLFFLGSKGSNAKKAADILRNKIPGIKIVGAISPSNNFGNDDAENIHLINEINNAKPNILFVGVGAPKSEKWIYNNRNKLNVNVALVMGHGFDLIVGDVKTSPKILTKIGFEWFYRLVQNPKYLFRRYILRDIPYFIRIIIHRYIKDQFFKNKNIV